MKALNLFVTVLVLTCFAFPPLTALAEEDLDDLDVTMEVLDDETGLDNDIADMAGMRDPQEGESQWSEDRPADADAAVTADDEGEYQEDYGDHDGFEHDDGIDDIGRIDDAQRDHEEGEDVEEDVFDDDEMEGADEPAGESTGG
jgi:hypothetical protein